MRLLAHRTTIATCVRAVAVRYTVGMSAEDEPTPPSPRTRPSVWWIVVPLVAVAGFGLTFIRRNRLPRFVFRFGGRLLPGIARRIGTIGLVFGIAVGVVWLVILLVGLLGGRRDPTDS